MTEITGLEGTLPDGRIVIVASRYNAAICDAMVKGSIQSLGNAGFKPPHVEAVRVPGAWELVMVAANHLDRDDVIGVITLGCVIKGETDHDLHISQAAAQGLTRVSIDARTPVAFGGLTTRTAEQAIERATSAGGGKGAEAMAAAIETARASRLVSDKAHDPWKASAAHSFAHGETDKASGGGDH